MIVEKRLKNLSYALISVLFVILLTACSNPKDANEKNFSKAIQGYLDVKNTYCIGAKSYPCKASAIQEASTPLYKTLASIGLVKKIGQTKGFNIKITYDLTDKGKKNFQPGKGFCYGRPVLLRVNNFSEPQNMFGHTISNVNYEYFFRGIPEWALEFSEKTKRGYRFKKIRYHVNSSVLDPIKGKDTLILTNKGWMHKRLFDR